MVLDVGEEGERGALDALARRAGGDRLDDAPHHVVHLAVDDDGVEPLLAAEVLVDDGLGDLGAVGDLLHRGALVAALGEHGAADVDELGAPLGAGEPSGPATAVHAGEDSTSEVSYAIVT